MERPDRTERTPAVATSQSSTRGLPENPAPGRRIGPGQVQLSNSNTLLPPPVPPVPTGSNIPTNGNLSASRVLTPTQVINLAKEAMAAAMENESQAAEASSAGIGLQSGVTIDLSRKNIQKLPEEVIDIVKDQLERYTPILTHGWPTQQRLTPFLSRLALSHNQLATLPFRFSECTSLRYLNIRGNQIKEFPMTVYLLRCPFTRRVD